MAMPPAAPGVYADFELIAYAATLRELLAKPELVPPGLLRGLETWYAECLNTMAERKRNLADDPLGRF
jgi:hypothetical protein